MQEYKAKKNSAQWNRTASDARTVSPFKSHQTPQNGASGTSMRHPFRPVLLNHSHAQTNLNKTAKHPTTPANFTITTPPIFGEDESDPMTDKNRIAVQIDRDDLRPDRTQFQEGNTAAAKPKWSDKKLQKFADELRTFRELIGFNYSEMGRALGVSGQYVKLIERAERQPSDKLAHLFYGLKASQAPITKGERLSTEALEHVSEIWKHILAHRFKCPGCAKEVRQGKRHRGLEYWWAATPNQKYCPDHHAKRKPKPKA